MTLNFIAMSKNRSEVAIAGRGPVPPALLTSTSRRPKCSDRRIDQPPPIVVHQDVGDDGESRAAGRLDLRDHLVEVGLGARTDHDAGSGLGQAQRDSATDALAGTGDDRDAPVEPELVEDHFVRPSPNCGAARPANNGRSR